MKDYTDTNEYKAALEAAKDAYQFETGERDTFPTDVFKVMYYGRMIEQEEEGFV